RRNTLIPCRPPAFCRLPCAGRAARVRRGEERERAVPELGARKGPYSPVRRAVQRAMDRDEARPNPAARPTAISRKTPALFVPCSALETARSCARFPLRPCSCACSPPLCCVCSRYERTEHYCPCARCLCHLLCYHRSRRLRGDLCQPDCAVLTRIPDEDGAE